MLIYTATEAILFCKWKYFVRIIADKLNATVKFHNHRIDDGLDAFYSSVKNLSANRNLDFYLDFTALHTGALYSYNQNHQAIQSPN